MTATTFQMTFDALPKKGQIELQAFVEYIQHKYFAKKRKFPKNPNNPSPSGDIWFDDPRNLAIVEEAINAPRTGKEKVIRTKDELLEFWNGL